MSEIPSKKYTVFVVDDEEQYRHDIEGAMKAVFQGKGEYEVFPYTNPTDATKAMLEIACGCGKVDLAIIDMHMPASRMVKKINKSAGFLALSTLKNFKERFDTKTIIFTAWPSYKDCVAAMRLGASDYILKYSTAPEDEEFVEEIPDGNLGELIASCKALLFPEEEELLTSEWKYHNMNWVQDKFVGRWVAFIPSSLLKGEGLTFDPGHEFGERDGIVLVAREAYLDLVEVLIASEALLRNPPLTWYVPRLKHLNQREDAKMLWEKIA